MTVHQRVADEFIAVEEACRKACWHRDDGEAAAKEWADAVWEQIRKSIGVVTNIIYDRDDWIY